MGKRILITDHLMALGDKVDGDILWRSLRKSEIKVSLATVYYTLNWLVEAGFIEKELTKDRRNVFAVKNRPWDTIPFGSISTRSVSDSYRKLFISPCKKLSTAS